MNRQFYTSVHRKRWGMGKSTFWIFWRLSAVIFVGLAGHRHFGCTAAESVGISQQQNALLNTTPPRGRLQAGGFKQIQISGSSSSSSSSSIPALVHPHRYSVSNQNNSKLNNDNNNNHLHQKKKKPKNRRGRKLITPSGKEEKILMSRNGTITTLTSAPEDKENTNDDEAISSSPIKEPFWWLDTRIQQISKPKSIRVRGYLRTGLRPLKARQQRILRREPNLIFILQRALRHAQEQCQTRLNGRSSLDCNKTTTRMFGNVASKASREAAFLYALISASVVRETSKACANGELSTCSCDERKRGYGGKNWKWAGCSDNIPYALRLSRRFIDASEDGTDLRTQMNRHNNQAGRAFARSSAEKRCICVGRFASCTYKNCWRNVKTIEDISHGLYEKVKTAARLADENSNKWTSEMKDLMSGGGKSKYRSIRRRRRRRLPRPGKSELVYLEESPKFCLRDGSRCPEQSIESCGRFCCAGYYKKPERILSDKCNCHFYNCCQVICQTCNITRETLRCV